MNKFRRINKRGFLDFVTIILVPILVILIFFFAFFLITLIYSSFIGSSMNNGSLFDSIVSGNYNRFPWFFDFAIVFTIFGIHLVYVVISYKQGTDNAFLAFGLIMGIITLFLSLLFSKALYSLLYDTSLYTYLHMLPMTEWIVLHLYIVEIFFTITLMAALFIKPKQDPNTGGYS